ncbi:MAG: HPr(Ser) kinase/phosphatase, partial [Puniceicoccales bacterium]|nr:HPr(Ser) kinase/phosphatase [Puniceicoccales bacterium]
MKELLRINYELVVRHFFEMTQNLLKLKLISGENGLDVRKIADRAVNRPALALTGYFKHFAEKRLQYSDSCELSYLLDLNREDQLKAIGNIDDRKVPCFVITNRIAIPQYLIDFFNERALPLFLTALNSVEFIERATIFLNEYFSPKTTLSGTLIEIRGIGVLIQGLPALSKSICTVTLVERGNTLIADDVVCVSCGQNKTLIGRSKKISYGFMEFRGIGLLQLTDLFGMHSMRYQSTIDLVIRFEETLSSDVAKSGLEEPLSCEILGITLPLITLPCCSGSDSCRLIEIATMLQLLKANGNNPAEKIEKCLIEQLPRGLCPLDSRKESRTPCPRDAAPPSEKFA